MTDDHWSLHIRQQRGCVHSGRVPWSSFCDRRTLVGASLSRPTLEEELSVGQEEGEGEGGRGRASKPVSGIDTEEVSRPLHVDIRALCERRRGVGADWHAL